MNKRPLFIAFILVISCHLLALYAMSLKSQAPVVVAPSVLEAVIINIAASEPKKTVTLPIKPATVKKTPPPPKNSVKKSITQPKKVIAINKPDSISDSTLTVPPTETEPPTESEPTTEPVVESSTEVAVALPYIDAKNKDNPPPLYPRNSRKLGQQGTVILNIYILANGAVGEVQLKKSSGYSRLDEAAIAAAKTWHYVPAKRGNDNINFWYEHAVRFVLN